MLLVKKLELGHIAILGRVTTNNECQSIVNIIDISRLSGPDTIFLCDRVLVFQTNWG